MKVCKVLSIFGTRPEAIKLAPLLRTLAEQEGVDSRICVSAQHREMLDQVVTFFELKVHYDFDLMHEKQSLNQLNSRMLDCLDNVLNEEKPDIVLVQGDTSSAMAGALAAYNLKIPIAHIEAGLRTHNLLNPWPEEGNRKLISAIATYHYVPTPSAKANLLAENISEDKIVLTGNTVIDALLMAKQTLAHNQLLLEQLNEQYPFVNEKFILITGHRRESFGDGFNRICAAISQLADNNPNIQFVYPVHLNPLVHEPVHQLLASHANVHLIAPVPYHHFVYLMSKTFLILSDSGGIQEEAPSLGKPVLVLREHTERKEAIASGHAILLGTNTQAIVQKTQSLIDNQSEYLKMTKSANPYGDGNASHKIIKHLLSHIT